MKNYNKSPKYVLWNQKAMEENPLKFYERLKDLNNTIIAYDNTELTLDIITSAKMIRCYLSGLEIARISEIHLKEYPNIRADIVEGIGNYEISLEKLLNQISDNLVRELNNVSFLTEEEKPIKSSKSESHWLGDECYDPFLEGNKTIGGLK